MGNRKPHQSAKKRPVYVNGIYCESLAVASRVTGIPSWKLHRVANAEIEIERYKVTEKQEITIKLEHNYSALINYPRGHKPIDRGIPILWR